MVLRNEDKTKQFLHAIDISSEMNGLRYHIDEINSQIMHMLFQYKILGFLKEKYMCIPLTYISIVYNGNVLYLIIVHVYHMIYIHSQTCLNGHLYKKQLFIKTTFPSSLEWTLYTGFTVFDIRIVEELCLFMIMTLR